MIDLRNGLTFVEESHEYFLHDKRIPSVSELLKPVSSMVYGSAPKWVMGRAAQKGTDIHSLCEAYIKFGYVPSEHEYLGYVQGFQKWHTDKQPDIIGSEIQSYHRSTAYAGTVDILTQTSIHDIKTGKQAHPEMWLLQMSAYVMMIRSHGLTDVNSASIIQLLEDGTYQSFEYSWPDLAYGYEVFKQSADLSRYLEQSKNK